MATYTKFQTGIEGLLETVNAGTDSWVIKLATAVSASLGTITEVANGGGYTTGGNSAGVNSTPTQAAGTYTLTLANPTAWTATTGFTFQYAVLTDSTSGTNVAYWDYGSSQAVATGETVTVTFPGAVFTAA